MTAQAKAVNVIYHDVVLDAEATFEATDDGGFIQTPEPLPVGSKVTVELLEAAEQEDALQATGRMFALVARVREQMAKGPEPGMRVRFVEEAEFEAPPTPPKPPPTPEAEATPDAEPEPEAEAEVAEEDGVDEVPAEEAGAEQSFEDVDKTLEMSAELPPTDEAAPGEQTELPDTGEAPAEEPAAEEPAAEKEPPKKKKATRKKKKKAADEGDGDAPQETPAAEVGAAGDANAEEAPKKKKRRRRKKK